MDLSTALGIASAAVDESLVDEEILGNLAINEMVVEITTLVGGELTRLTGLGEDADANEKALRTVVQNAALKALLAGMVYVRDEPREEVGIPIYVPQDVYVDLALTMIREGSATFTLTPGSYDSNE